MSIAHTALLNVCRECVCGCVLAYSDVGQHSSEDMSHSEVDLWRRSSRTPPHPTLRCQHSNRANGQHHSNRLHHTQWKHQCWIPPQLPISPSHTPFMPVETAAGRPVQHCSNMHHVKSDCDLLLTQLPSFLEHTSHKQSLPSLLCYRADCLNHGECFTIKLLRRNMTSDGEEEWKSVYLMNQ